MGVPADWADSTCKCRGACDIVERAFNYAWMQAGFSLENAEQQPGNALRVRNVALYSVTPGTFKVNESMQAERPAWY